MRHWLKSVALVMVSGILLGGLWLALGQSPALALTDEQQLVAEVWRIVNRAYLDENFNHQNWWFARQRVLKQALPDRDATYDAIQGMLALLEDPYTRLLRPQQYRSLQTSTSGELTGVGLQIAKEDDQSLLQVIASIEGSPADGANLQPQDQILAIDDVSTVGMTLDEAAGRMRGAVGTSVALLVQRGGEDQPFIVTLKRDVVSLNPVSASLGISPGGLKVGYIRLSQFNANAREEVATAIGHLADQGAAAYVLDLRNNPGGLLQAGIEIARLWLNQGTIVYTVSRQGILESYGAHESALTQAPLVVLVNEGTASASEILAGALQENDRATLVGSVTFGKGLIQSLFDLSDGSGLAVTVAKYETPAHHDINRRGIIPDRLVESVPLARLQFGSELDPQYQAALNLLDQSMVLAGVP